MDLQLIKGEFSSKDAYEIIAKMLDIKIKFHENKIDNESSEEDIKYRESKIKFLQNELENFRNYFRENGEFIKLNSKIEIN